MLRQSAQARDFVRAFDFANKPIASLCHGPWVLASAGLLNGRVLTSWPGVRDDLVNAGATWIDKEVVWDRNLVTSRGPQDLVPFVRALKSHFAAGAALHDKTRATQSSPQNHEPPKLVLGFTTAFPLPKFKLLFTVGVIAGGIYALKNSGAISGLQRKLIELLRWRWYMTLLKIIEQLALVLLDVFLTVLYARVGTGIISTRVARGSWRTVRALAKTMPSRSGKVLSFIRTWAPVSRQAAGLPVLKRPSFRATCRSAQRLTGKPVRCGVIVSSMRRHNWNWHIRNLAPSMLYSLEEIDPALFVPQSEEHQRAA
jgi:hypothetical protein